MEKKAVRVAYGEALVKLGEENEKVVVLDADLAAFGLYLCLALDVEVHIDVVRLCSIHVKGDAGNETGDVAWAAGASEPLLALVLTIALQGIVIEELIAA